MPTLTAILAGLTALAGWYYLFFSRSGHRLASVEPAPTNRVRILLRKLNGLTILALAVLMYVGSNGLDSEAHPLAFVVVWLVVIALLAIIMLLVGADVWLTLRLRRSSERARQLAAEAALESGQADVKAVRTPRAGVPSPPIEPGSPGRPME